MTSIGRPPPAAISATQLLGVGLDEVVDALDEGVRDALGDGQRPPGLDGFRTSDLLRRR
jgi:hypothetical protein